jgi:CRP/FNR family cyclic AMP-dependent transcriptional regulator
MPCAPEELKHVPLFALLDQEEIAVLAAQVELKTFAPRQRIYKMGDPGMHAYILMSGSVQVSTVDEDHQEVVVDQPGHGQFFGFASMLEQTAHQTSALAMEKSVCVEISRDDIAILLERIATTGTDSGQPQRQRGHRREVYVRRTDRR